MKGLEPSTFCMASPLPERMGADSRRQHAESGPLAARDHDTRGHERTRLLAYQLAYPTR